MLFGALSVVFGRVVTIARPDLVGEPQRRVCERRVRVTHRNLSNSIPFLPTRAASMASNNLSSLLTASKALTSHLQRPDLPSVNLSLDQIEAQSRRLVAGQPGAPADSGRGSVPPVSCAFKRISHLSLLLS